MRKILKLIGIVCVSLLLLAVTAIIVLILFVSPNRLKPIITEQVQQNTGRTLTIDGDLSWSFFPNVGVKVGHMVINNPATFKQTKFAEINHATVGVKLLPLLHGQIESSGIALTGMTLNLIKNSKGDVNWNFATTNTAPVSSKQESSPAETTTSPSTALGVIASIDISDTNILWNDEQTGSNYAINNFELHTHDVQLDQPFPISTTFDFSANKPATSGHIALTGDMVLKQAEQLYTYRNMMFKAEITQGGKKINLNITGNIDTDLAKQTLQWTDLKGKIANLSLTGAINVNHLNNQPVTSGNVHIEPFDLKELLQNLGQNTDSIQSAKKVNGDLKFNIATNNINSQGKFNIGELQAAKLKMTDINIKTDFAKGILTLNPITANLYKGDLQSQATINLNGTSPKITLQAKLNKIDAEPLLQDLGPSNKKLKLTGLANSELQITTSGTDANTILSNLNGNANFSFADGTLVGINIGYYIDSAYALIQRKSPPSNDSDTTHFGSLTASAVITNGVINNKDLHLDSPRFDTRGSGNIDLVKQQINFNLQTSVKKRNQADDISDLYGIPIGVLITGNLSDPSIRPDTSSLLNAIAQRQLQNVQSKVQDKIQEKIKDQIKGQAGELIGNLLGK